MLERLSVLFAALALCSLSVAQTSAPTPVHIYGIHSWANGANGLFNGKRGWTVESVNTANYSFDLQPSQAQQIVAENFELIIRINKEAGLTVPTDSSQWDQFASNCAAKVTAFAPYCHTWIIGNEMNADFEGSIPVSTYAEVYRRCRSAIHAVQPNAIVAVGAVAPWNATQRPSGTYTDAWLNYMYQLVNTLGSEADAYALHAYGGRSNDSTRSDPRDDSAWGFGIFKQWMEIIDANPSACNVPVYLTEMNHAADGGSAGYPSYSYPQGYINRCFEAINSWNTTHAHRIKCACWFAYSNGGFPGYDITLNSTMASDFSTATRQTSYVGTLTAAKEWQLFE